MIEHSTAEPETRESRVGRKERTRRRLIEAAAEVMAERGFHDASLMEVASRAGVTTGAVYSNFRNKEDLFLAVIREAAIPLDLGSESDALWQRLGRATMLALQGVDLPATRRLFRMQLEFALLTLQDRALRDASIGDIRADSEELAKLLEDVAPVPRPQYKPSPEELATTIIATLQGLQQHRFVDPASMPEELADWAVQALLHAASPE